MPDERPTGNLFRCDYCGQYRLRSEARIFWTVDYELDADTIVWVPAVYCSDFCGANGSAQRVGG